ncbi:hypothetical protein BB560_003254 [Smittium megazygosporum]|uniref:ABC transporter domain-containing protein n=1 Tax=Smittium megazygosporum TaxID=133381 RepID=A0A2T9ZCH9_9FUNG|nr:hypothetical protein BB560_003254 [Smittium megazygosporum]
MNHIELINVGYKTKPKHKDELPLTILRNVSIKIKGGEFMAILGSSGAGKTTLLNIIGGRVASGVVTGQVKYNGEKRIPSEFKKIVSIVEQDLVMPPMLTVRETLQFTADLLVPPDKIFPPGGPNIVDEVMDEFSLNKIRDSIVEGVRKRGVSGGEKKLVGIATRLLKKPKVLILDEPTTGLDSSTTEYSINLVKKYTSCNKTIAVCSIHQPNFTTFHLFDKVIILSAFGIVYYGPTSKIDAYFASIGYRSLEFENPIDYYMRLITVRTETEESKKESMVEVKNLVNTWNEKGDMFLNSKSSSPMTKISTFAGSSLSRRISSDSNYSSYEEILDQRSINSSEVNWHLTHWKEFKVLLRRSWIFHFRDPSLVVSFLAMGIFSGLILGFTFFNPGSGLNEIINRTGLVFLICLYLSFLVTLPLLLILDGTKSIFLYERSYSMYRTFAFYFSLHLTLFPIIWGANLLMMIQTYFLAKFQYLFYKFLIFVIILTTTISCSISFAIASIAWLSFEVASIACPLILALFGIFGGNLVNVETIPPVIRWIRYLSYFYYSYCAILINEFKGKTFDCSTRPGQNCEIDYKGALAALGLGEIRLFFAVLMNIAIMLFFLLIGYLGFRFHLRSKFILV